ncbi:MAG: hypothetical protein LBM03_01570 [Erysipelotrichaceae bacterium]|jgi:hypothetical protein|nr:hypothetical protein [Erysipelotrichaceae bacterium]
MKKEDVSALFVYLFILAIALFFGLSVLQGRAGQSELGNSFMIYVIGAILVGVVANAIIFELAHVIGAKIGGYSIISVNILGLCWYKESKKWKFKFASFDGLTGETKIYPKENPKKEPNPLAYLLFGTLFYFVEVIGVIILILVASNERDMAASIWDVAFFCIIEAFIGLLILIYNILPFKLDSVTDGYRLTLVSNTKNRIAYNELLRVEHEIAIGNTNVEIKTFDQITNFTADLNLNKIYLLLDNKKYDNATILIKQIIDARDSVSDTVYLRAVAQLLYIQIMTLPLVDAQAYFEERVPVPIKRDISKDGSMVSIRTYVLIAGLLEKSKSECVIALNNVKSALKHTNKERRIIEIKLLNEALDKVINAHPSWELEKFKLDEKELKK